MCGGALMQLVAYGAQDIYLTGNPQITFFKVVYRRHTNFSMESIEQTFNGNADFGKRVTCTIARNGDLIHRVYLQVTLPQVRPTLGSTPGYSARQLAGTYSLNECGVPTRFFEGTECDFDALGETDEEGYTRTSGYHTETAHFMWVNYVGHQLINNVEVEIGGQRIDKHYGDWLNIWNELTQEPGHQAGYDSMVGNTAALTGAFLRATEATTLYIPLQFWFCRNPGLALPLIALQYHEVRINLEFRQKEELFLTQNASIESCNGFTKLTVGCGNTGSVCVGGLEQASLYVDYIFLDTDERRRFAQVSHEYLIEQLQFTGDENIIQTTWKSKLNFNHPVKELIWVVQRDSVTEQNWLQWTNYTDNYDFDRNVESGYTAQSFPSHIIASLKVTANAFGPGGIIPNRADNSGSLINNGTGGASGPALMTTPWVNNLAPGFNIPPGPGDSVGSAGPINFGNPDGSAGADHPIGVLNAGRNPVVRAKLQLNGQDRFQNRLGSYFNLVQPYQHHTNIPATGINVYSFALKPEEHQPSGSCNFSRIDTATLQLQVTPFAAIGSKLRVYAVNYNVLRIMSGMGGLAYSS